MKHTHYTKAMRLFSVIVLIAMLTTSGTFAIYANELPVIVNSIFTSTYNPQTHLSEPKIIPDDTFALMQRMSEFDSFTDAEKNKIYDLLGNSYDHDSLAEAIEQQEYYRMRHETMPDIAKKEATVRWIINDHETYSNVPIEDKETLLGLLNIHTSNLFAF